MDVELEAELLLVKLMVNVAVQGEDNILREFLVTLLLTISLATVWA